MSILQSLNLVPTFPPPAIKWSNREQSEGCIALDSVGIERVHHRNERLGQIQLKYLTPLSYIIETFFQGSNIKSDNREQKSENR